MDIIGLRVPTLKLRGALLFCVSLYFRKCPTIRCVTAVNSGCGDLDDFRRQTVTLSQILYCFNFDIKRRHSELCKYSFVPFVCVCFMFVLFIVVCYLCLCI